MSNKYIGDFTPGVVVRFRFNMFATSFVPTTPTVAPTFCVYKNSTVESTAGITVTVDYDGRAGVVFVAIDTSADPTFYVAGEDYDVMFTAGTVDGNDMARVFVRMFSLENRSRKANVVQIAGQTANAAAAVTFPASPAAVADIPTVSAVADAVWDEVLTGATHNIQSSAGRRLRQLASVIVRAGTAQGSGTGNNQIQLDAGASAINGEYDPGLIFIETGTGAGQARLILQYNGSTKVATVDRDWRVNPDNTSEFVILADAGRNSVNEGLAQAATATTITLNTSASSNDDAYNGQLIFIRSGTGQDQVGLVEDYVGSTKVATVRTRSATGQWAIVPDATSAYVMIPNLTFTVSEIQSGLAREATVTQLDAVVQTVKDDTTALINSVASVSARIGAFTGAGVNTILGFFRALMRKDGSITTPSDVGGAFVHTTDSLEAIRDRGDAAWTSGGGAGGVTNITVEDRSITLD